MPCNFPGCLWEDGLRECSADGCSSHLHHFCFNNLCYDYGCPEPEGSSSYCFTCCQKHVHYQKAAAAFKLASKSCETESGGAVKDNYERPPPDDDESDAATDKETAAAEKRTHDSQAAAQRAADSQKKTEAIAAVEDEETEDAEDAASDHNKEPQHEAAEDAPADQNFSNEQEESSDVGDETFLDDAEVDSAGSQSGTFSSSDDDGMGSAKSGEATSKRLIRSTTGSPISKVHQRLMDAAPSTQPERRDEWESRLPVIGDRVLLEQTDNGPGIRGFVFDAQKSDPLDVLVATDATADGTSPTAWVRAKIDAASWGTPGAHVLTTEYESPSNPYNKRVQQVIRLYDERTRTVGLPCAFMVGLKAGFTPEQPNWLLCSGYVPAVAVEQANPVSTPKQLSELHCGKHVHYTLDKGVPTVYINGDTDVCPPSIPIHGGAGIFIGVAVGLLDPPFNLHCAIISTNLHQGKEVNGRCLPYICVPIESVHLGKPESDSTILTTRYKMQSTLNSVARRISATPAFIEAALKADQPPYKEGSIQVDDDAPITVDEEAPPLVLDDKAPRAGIGRQKRKAAEVSNELSRTGMYGLRSKEYKKRAATSGRSNARHVLGVNESDSELNEDSPEAEPAPRKKSSNKSKTAPDDLKNWGQKKLLTLSTPELKRLADVHKVKRPRSGDEVSKRDTVLKLCLKLRKRYKHGDDDEDNTTVSSNKGSERTTTCLPTSDDNKVQQPHQKSVSKEQPASKRKTHIDCGTSSTNSMSMRVEPEHEHFPLAAEVPRKTRPMPDDHAQSQKNKKLLPGQAPSKQPRELMPGKDDSIYSEGSDHSTKQATRMCQPPSHGPPYQPMHPQPFVPFYGSPACMAPGGQPMYFTSPYPPPSYPPALYPSYPPYGAMRYAQPTATSQTMWPAPGGLQPFKLGSEWRAAQKKKALKRQLDCLLSAQAAEPSAARAEQITNLKHDLQDLEDDE